MSLSYLTSASGDNINIHTGNLLVNGTVSNSSGTVNFVNKVDAQVSGFSALGTAFSVFRNSNAPIPAAFLTSNDVSSGLTINTTSGATVPVAGTYRIYSKISFQFSNTAATNFYLGIFRNSDVTDLPQSISIETVPAGASSLITTLISDFQYTLSANDIIRIPQVTYTGGDGTTASILLMSTIFSVQLVN